MRLTSTALATFILSAGVASAATFVDFTDSAKWSGSNAGPVSYGDFSVTLTSNPAGAINFNQSYDGPAAHCAADGGALACGNDGVGIVDDETSTDGDSVQELTVSFSKAVKITGFQLLDFFVASDEADHETALIAVNGGSAVSYSATEIFTPGGGGFFSEAVDWSNVTSLTLFAASSNDDNGVADFALASLEATVETAPVPLPAAALLLGAGMAGFAFVGRRRS